MERYGMTSVGHWPRSSGWYAGQAVPVAQIAEQLDRLGQTGG
jgi:hypothetical protein